MEEEERSGVFREYGSATKGKGDYLASKSGTNVANYFMVSDRPLEFPVGLQQRLYDIGA